MRVETAAGSSDRIGGNRIALFETIFGAISRNAIFDGVIQLLRGRTQVAPAGVGSIIAIAGRGGARMKIFLSGKSLSEQLRTANGSVLVDNEAPIGLIVESSLRDAEDDERINSAANDSENDGRHDR